MSEETVKVPPGDEAEEPAERADQAAESGEAAIAVADEPIAEVTAEETAAGTGEPDAGTTDAADAFSAGEPGEATVGEGVEPTALDELAPPPAEDDAPIAAEDDQPIAGQPPVVDAQLKAVVEALIFASPEPLTSKMLFKLLDGEPKEDVERALESLRCDYETHAGLQLVEVANGYQIVTRPEMHEWVRRLFHERKTQKLSVQALETLAVIAYKQPITAPEIGEIRGVNTGGVLSTLLERHLIKISGRKAVVGRPFLYSTTREFLIRFGLRDLSDLPKVEDLADVLGFEPPVGLAEAGPSEGQLPLEVEAEPVPAEGEPSGSDEEKVH